MANRDYEQAILDTLQGRAKNLRAIPPERLDWSGPGALLELFRQTSGSDREALIRAIGRLIERHPAPPAVIVQLVEIASALDLAQVEPQVQKLQAEPFAGREPLKSAVTNYLAFRELNTAAQSADLGSKVSRTNSSQAPRSQPAKKGRHAHG